MFSQSNKIKKHVSCSGWYCLATSAWWILLHWSASVIGAYNSGSKQKS